MISRRAAVLCICLTIVVTSAVSATAAGVLITGKNVKNSSLTGVDVKNSSLSGADIKSGSIQPGDLAPGVGAAGAQGPAGATGPTGPQGAAGSARAYGEVSRGALAFVAARTKGFSSVTRPATGQYCLNLEPGSAIDPATTPILASVENGSSSVNGVVEVWGGVYAPCGPKAFHIRTYTYPLAQTDGISFTVMVP